MEFLKSVVKKYTETSLIIRIVIGLVAGAILGRTMTGWTWIGILGSMFVGALRAVAPVLVFVLIISALSNGQSKLDSKFGLVLSQDGGESCLCNRERRLYWNPVLGSSAGPGL